MRDVLLEGDVCEGPPCDPRVHVHPEHSGQLFHRSGERGRACSGVLDLLHGFLRRRFGRGRGFPQEGLPASLASVEGPCVSAGSVPDVPPDHRGSIVTPDGEPGREDGSERLLRDVVGRIALEADPADPVQHEHANEGAFIVGGVRPPRRGFGLGWVRHVSHVTWSPNVQNAEHVPH